MFNLFNKYRKKIKIFAVSLVPILLISIYIALLFRHLIVCQEIKYGLITLIKDIPEYGFPIGSTLFIFFSIIGFIIFTIWRATHDEFVEDSRNFKYSDSGVYGTAGFLQESELKGYAKVETAEKAKGTILGQTDTTGKKIINTDLESKMNHHIAVFGASGTGKSRCFARPFIIQAVKRRESVIVTDPKGELYESTAQYMKDNGYIVKVFNLVHPDKSDGWNCLRELRGDEIRTQIFANTIISNTGDGSKDVWADSAMSLLKALLLRVERGHDFKNANRQSIGEAYNLIQNPGGEDFLDTIFDADELRGDERICIGPYMTFKQASPNMRGNIITGLATRIQVFQNEVIRKITAVDDIDLTLPAQRPCAYFVIMSDQHSTLNFLSSLFFSLAFIDLVEYADAQPGNRCQVPVNLLLDEFPNIGSIPDFEKKIATVRSRCINISMIFQGITQLQERYPFGKWTGILGNCDTHLFLGCNEPETAKFISDRTGEATVKVKTEQHKAVESIFDIGRKHSSGDGKRKIMTPDEVMRLPWNQEIIIFRGMNVLKSYKYDYSLHPEAEKFKVVRIMDRPSIFDEKARQEYTLQDKHYLEAYEKRKDEEKNSHKEDETEQEEKNILKNIMRVRKKKNNQQTENTLLKIRPGEDIELSQDDYIELSEEEMDENKKTAKKRKTKKTSRLPDIDISDIQTISIISEQEIPEIQKDEFDIKCKTQNPYRSTMPQKNKNKGKEKNYGKEDIDKMLDREYKSEDKYLKSNNTAKTVSISPKRQRMLYSRPEPDKAGDALIEDWIEETYKQIEKIIPHGKT